MTQTLQSHEPAGAGNGDPRHRAEGSTPVPAARTPVSSSTLTLLGLLWAVLLIALGVVGIHDALVVAGAVGGPQWIVVVVGAVGDLRLDPLLLVVATLLGLVGLGLVLLALRRRRKRGVAVGAEAGTFVRHRHLSRLVASRVETLDGVVSAGASARRRTVNVRVRGVDGVDADDLRSRAQAMLGEDLAVMDKPVRTRVRVEGRTR